MSAIHPFWSQLTKLLQLRRSRERQADQHIRLNLNIAVD